MRDNVRQCLKENSEKNYNKVRLEMLSMMSMEERAMQYAYRDGEIVDAYYNNYINIATEQKAIDESDLQTAKQTYFDAGYETAKKMVIDKACNWLYKNADSYDRGNGYHLNELLEDFDKAMAE